MGRRINMAKEIFGIELEIPLKVGVSVNQFRECLVSAIGSDLVHQPNHGRIVGYHSDEYESNIDKWRVASDSSLHEFQGRGVEIVSRRRTSLKETKKAMEATRHLVDLDLMTRTSCGGHHVHIGILHFSAIKRTYDPETSDGRYKLIRTKRVKLLEVKIHEIYAYFQPVLNAIVSRSRRTGSGREYNRGVNSNYLEAKNNENSSSYSRKEDYLNSTREQAPLWGNRGVVNFGKLSSYGTVEYRQHQQTYHVSTVQNWVKLMHRITSRAWVQETKNIDPSDYPVTVDGLADFLGLGANRLRAWMRRRANHFGFSAIARENGVNPVVGVRARSTLSSLGPELREYLSINDRRQEEINRLYDAIVLACANHESTYNLVKFAYLEFNLSARNLREICENNIPVELLPSGLSVGWDSLNWESIRSEVIEAIETQ
jgi:hypothetical protein